MQQEEVSPHDSLPQPGKNWRRLAAGRDPTARLTISPGRLQELGLQERGSASDMNHCPGDSLPHSVSLVAGINSEIDTSVGNPPMIKLQSPPA